jgi:hypothetical protein
MYPMPNLAAPAPGGQSAAPTVLPARRGFALIFGVVAVLVTAGALALAAYGQTTLSAGADAPPSGWGQVYNADLTASDSQWDTSQGCTFTSDGLEASANATCAFVPSTSANPISQGFQLTVSVAPAAQVSGELAPFIQLGDQPGDQVYVGITQEGQYSICAVVSCSTLSEPREQGTTILWHGDAFVANTLTVRYEPNVAGDTGRVTLFVNGQQAAQATATLSRGATLALGTPTGGEAIFTHATLYSAS